jgi:uncharacterized protein
LKIRTRTRLAFNPTNQLKLVAIACLLHDIGRWYSGCQANHAAQGEVPVRRFLEKTELSTDVKEQIVQAVIHHSDKQIIGTDLEEIVKDADILDGYTDYYLAQQRVLGFS